MKSAEWVAVKAATDVAMEDVGMLYEKTGALHARAGVNTGDDNPHDPPYVTRNISVAVILSLRALALPGACRCVVRQVHQNVAT
jgi:hypothetical protein